MAEVRGLPLATNAEEALTLVFEASPPEVGGPDWERLTRGYYRDAAIMLADALQRYLPGGLVDALFGELAYRKASIFQVTGDKR